MRQSRLWSRGSTLALLSVLGVMFALPFFWMIATSLRDPHEFANPATPGELAFWLPRQFTPENYAKVWSDRQFNLILYARNTIIIAVLQVLGATLSSSLVAYALARLQWYGRNLLLLLVLGCMMVPFSVTMVTQYDIFRTFGLIGTTAPLWLPSFFGVPFYIFLLRQFYITIPQELSEAARLDGCSEFTIWWRIVLPLSKPALTVVALFAFMGAWNDFLGPLIYLNHQRQFTLAVALQSFQSQSGGVSWELLMAASAIVIAPVLALFLLAQKTFVQGIATTGMKG
ncbi:MAG: carbohydrate ABC transporter permease [Phycisphaerae bacterium]